MVETRAVPPRTAGSAGRNRPLSSRSPLNSGERLTRPEFERRYSARPDINKAELVEGVVYVAEPVRAYAHGKPQSALHAVFATYAAFTPGVHSVDNTTVRLDENNEPQPDAALFIEADAGGQSRVDADGYIEGAPELVAEIAASTASRDLHEKLRAYRRNGVREHLVWSTLHERIDWFELVDGEYAPMRADGAGILHSKVFPGLRLAAEAMLAD